MIPAEVFNGHELARSTAHGPIRYRSNDCARQHAERHDCNGLDVTEAAYSLHSSIGRLYEHHMVPAEVCYGHEPLRPTSYGRDIDLTTAGHPK